MLKIFNDLEPFFEYNYRRISIREYARIKKISPPSASTLLHEYHNEGLLEREEDKKYIYFESKRENPVFVNLSRTYWWIQFKKIGLIGYLEKELVNPLIILFGSFSKAEVAPNSDIDIAVCKSTSKNLKLNQFEKKLNRNIQIIFFDDAKINLQQSILNGFILFGSW